MNRIYRHCLMNLVNMLEHTVVNPCSSPSLVAISVPALHLSAYSVMLWLLFVSQGCRVHPQPEDVACCGCKQSA